MAKLLQSIGLLLQRLRRASNAYFSIQSSHFKTIPSRSAHGQISTFSILRWLITASATMAPASNCFALLVETPGRLERCELVRSFSFSIAATSARCSSVFGLSLYQWSVRRARVLKVLLVATIRSALWISSSPETDWDIFSRENCVRALMLLLEYGSPLKNGPSRNRRHQLFLGYIMRIGF